MESRLLLDVVVRQGPPVVELFARKDEALLIGRDAFLILDLGLDGLNSVGGFDVQGDGLAGESLHEDLHSTAESEDQVNGGLLLNVVVGEGFAIVQLLAGEDQSLLVPWDTLLVLDLSLHILDGISRLAIKSNSLARKGLNEDLHWHLACCCYY